jgi:hypothetical protein
VDLDPRRFFRSSLLRRATRRRLFNTALVAVASGVVIAQVSCGYQTSQGPRLTSVSGVTELPFCNTLPASDNPDSNYSAAVHIHVPASLDDVFGTNDVTNDTRHVKYDFKDTSTTPANDAQDDSANDSNETSTNTTVLSNPYHSDLTTPAAIAAGNVFKYVVRLDPNSSMVLEKLDPKNGHELDGVLVDDNLISPSSGPFVCMDGFVPGSGGKVVRFYVKNKSGAVQWDGFNIVVVPAKRSVNTVVVIDPQILNNG